MSNQINHQLNLPISIFFLIALWPWYINESNIPETVKTPEHNTQTLLLCIQSNINKDACFLDKFEIKRWKDALKLPPTIAHTFVRKCKNEICPSVKVTCGIQPDDTIKMSPKVKVHVPESHRKSFLNSSSRTSITKYICRTKRYFLWIAISRKPTLIGERS